jgi:ubiquinone/menaquinone biosynthesis C-methylase UbiE
MRKLLRFFFHHFYHSFAWTYDFVAAVVSVGRWNDWISTALPHVRGPRVLEIGFGPGHLQVEMVRGGFQPLGLDESPQMIRQAQARLAQNGLPVTLLRGLAQSLPFAADSLDTIVSTFPSEFIMDRQALADVWRVLRPGGRFVVVPLAWVVGKSLLDGITRQLFKVTHQSVEPTKQVEDKIRSHFAEAGFRVNLIRTEIRQSLVIVVVAEKAEGQETSESPE